MAFMALTARAQMQLVESSPFLPAQGSMTAAAESGPLELRGILTTPQGPSFCIYDTAKKASLWVGLNEPGNGFIVRSHDPNSDTATVESQGRTITLALHQAKVAGSAIVMSGQPSNVLFNPTPPDEARRLESVAAEVQRRRLMRQQAASHGMPIPPPNQPPPGMGRPGN
jgi:hypothetical protein